MTREYIKLKVLFQEEDGTDYEALGIKVNTDKFETCPILVFKDTIEALTTSKFQDVCELHLKNNTFLVLGSYDKLEALILGQPQETII